MFWIVILQSTQPKVKELKLPPIVIKERPRNVWVYRWNYHVENIDWQYSPALNERVFGIGQSCSFGYISDINITSETTLRFYLKGRGKFVISISYSKGDIIKVIDLTNDWKEIIIDLTKPHIDFPEYKSLLTIGFDPLTNEFEIYISKFILKGGD
ncbi:MAG: hypothetical protein ABIL49_01770 [candidate division WOR-3 bacterium]